MNPIDPILHSLHLRRPTQCVHNPYKDARMVSNLRLYFERLLLEGPSVMAIGEAIGWRGARSTGIPFTCVSILKNPVHRTLKAIRERIELDEELSELTENSARTVWDFFAESKPAPVLWNAFPFHPHKPMRELTNRKPTVGELEEGKRYIRLLYEAYAPGRLVGIGRAGERVLREMFPNRCVEYVRHPSHGGRDAFLCGMRRVFER